MELDESVESCPPTAKSPVDLIAIGLGYVPDRSPPAVPDGGSAAGAPVTFAQATLVILASVTAPSLILAVVTPLGASPIYVVVTCPGVNVAGGAAEKIRAVPVPFTLTTWFAFGAVGSGGNDGVTSVPSIERMTALAAMLGFGYEPDSEPPAAPDGGKLVGGPVSLLYDRLTIFASVTFASKIFAVVTALAAIIAVVTAFVAIAGLGYVPDKLPPAGPLGGNVVGAPVIFDHPTSVTFAFVTQPF